MIVNPDNFYGLNVIKSTDIVRVKDNVVLNPVVMEIRSNGMQSHLFNEGDKISILLEM